MKIGIVGSNGFISKYLIKKFESSLPTCNIVRFDRSLPADKLIDLTHADRFDYSELNDVDYIVFTAAISSPDQCTIDYDNCWNINVVGTEYFINKALEKKCKVIFFSSDAVFGSDAKSIFTEESVTNASTAYGKMKKAIEDRFRGNEFFKVIRLSYVVSSNDKFIQYCLDSAKRGAKVEVFHPFYRNCITIKDVLDTIIWLIENWDRYKYWNLNVAGDELISRVRIVDELNIIFDNTIQYNIVCPDMSFFKNRPQVTQMSSIYNRLYNIYKDDKFSQKIKDELKGVEL